MFVLVFGTCDNDDDGSKADLKLIKLLAWLTLDELNGIPGIVNIGYPFVTGAPEIVRLVAGVAGAFPVKFFPQNYCALMKL